MRLFKPKVFETIQKICWLISGSWPYGYLHVSADPKIVFAHHLDEPLTPVVEGGQTVAGVHGLARQAERIVG